MSNIIILIFNIVSNSKMLSGQKFASVTEVQSNVRQWLGQHQAGSLCRTDKCLNESGRYVEK